ncbi:prepilin peptidase [Kineococcus gynurae]|uniref:Prepilin peptidase n=1 Tax=Kineococcus gynurae TaxID=452979 RepID=A0ABV5LUR1_9ACTN
MPVPDLLTQALPVLVTVAGITGLLIGSFLNVVIHRVPMGESVVSPPSRCPGCGAGIRPYDNVPVLSWVLLRGRCRSCAAPISARYPLVELATGLLFAVVTLWVGRAGEWWVLPAHLYLAAIAVALTMIDLDVHRLPDVIVLPSYPVALLLLGTAAVTGGSGDAFVRALLGGSALFALYALIWIVRPGGIGLGDVKLSGLLGLYLAWWGWDVLLVGAFAMFVLGGVAGVGLLLRGRAGRRTRLAFGPAMLAGGFLALFAGPVLAAWYLGLMGLGATV